MRPIILPIDLGERLIPYQEGWDLQRRLHAQVVAGETPPTVLLLEHEPTYTAGSRTQPADLPHNGEPVVEVDRGGRITWHGEGQLVAYPIVPLRTPVDVVAMVHALEDALIATCAEYGVATMRVPGRSGVWVDGADQPARKIAAVGIRVAKGVAMHGVALNVNCDLTAYDHIIPCGIADAGVTSLLAEGAADASVTGVSAALGSHLVAALSWD